MMEKGEREERRVQRGEHEVKKETDWPWSELSLRNRKFARRNEKKIVERKCSS